MHESEPLQHRVARLEAQAERDRREIDQLQTALASARTIGAATGIIMAGRKMTLEQAFQVLRWESQNQNIKLRDVADLVVATGVLPPGEDTPEPAG